MNEKFSLSTTVIVALFFSLTLWVFGPLHIFFTNSLEFGFLFSELAPYLLAIAAGFTIGISAVLYLLRNKFFQQGISLLFSLGLLLWIQGNILVWNYGPLDGREIHWKKKLLQGLFDFGLWMIVLIVALIQSKTIYKFARSAGIGFMLIQLVSLYPAYSHLPEIPSFKKYHIDDSTKYSFSSKTNVIILMLDTYQSDLFQEIINEDKQYKDIFRGFTYFRNALSVFPKTYTSAPSFLTGKPYDNSVPVQDFLKKAYTSETSLPWVLKQHGFRVELYPYPHTENTIYFNESIASNIKKREPGMFAFNDLGLLLDISLFRHVPHFVKKYVYNNQEWLLKRLFSSSAKLKKKTTGNATANSLNLSARARQLYDIQFIEQLSDEASATGETPVFKYYHLNGLHRPLVLTPKLDVQRMPYSQRASFKSQGKACLEISRLLIDKLKKMGRFDDALIVIMADHGCADYPYGVKIDAAHLTAAEPQGATLPSHIKAAGLPLLLIKTPGAKDEELKITDAPVSLKDLSTTLFSILGFGHPGARSMFDVLENESRERHFYYYNWNGWENDYLYTMRDYAVNGHAWLDASWKEAGIIRAASAKIPYEWGTKVSFGRDGNSARFLGIGWHGAGKDGFTWSREKKAELYFAIKPSQRGATLTMTFKPYIYPGKINSQDVHIYVNGNEIKRLTVTDPSEREETVVIPRQYLKNFELNILFEIPTAVSPAELNINNDVRNLGIALKSIVIE